MIPRKSSNTSGSIVSERLRANWEVDPTMGEFLKMVRKWVDSRSKKYLWTRKRISLIMM